MSAARFASLSCNLRDDMLRREAYGVETSSVERVETHSSWVFLLDHDVFKVKRPVDLGFLDFRSPEKRKRACESEVACNERLAPGVYRGVVPVRCGRDGRVRLYGTDPVVDWAVHMARLPDDARADNLLARGALEGRAVDRIAEHLASFHARSRTCSIGSGLVEANMEDNFVATTPVLSSYLAPAEADELVRWQRAFLRGHRASFEKRALTGRVREGHGDLRLEHIYLREGGISILDCIEFDERFRIGDVAADVAFLSMDLAAHGRVDLAERLLATYATTTSDFDLYELVDFYESYRAFVRGKIATFAASDSSLDRDTRDAARRTARRHFLLALSFDRRSLLSPVVIAVGGVIASGKSTLAERLGLELGAPVISADRIRKALLGVGATERVQAAAWKGAYDPMVTARVYRTMLRSAGIVAASGRPVVLDASFRTRAMRTAARDVAIEHNLPFRFVECAAPRDTCIARLAARERAPSVSDARAAIFDDFCAHYEAVAELPPTELFTVTTTAPIETTMRDLRSVIATWPTGFVA